MDANELYAGKSINASNLKADTRLTISGVELASFDDGSKKLRLNFRGTDKSLVLVKTNASTITKLFGSSNTDHWIGGEITLVKRLVEFKGDMVDGIRIDVEPGTWKAPEDASTDDDNDPFAGI